jgi:hypothetical protein
MSVCPFVGGLLPPTLKVSCTSATKGDKSQSSRCCPYPVQLSREQHRVNFSSFFVFLILFEKK